MQTNPTPDALVERLRAYRSLDEWCEQGVHHVICDEAADTLTAMQERIERLEAENAKLDAECERAWSAYRIAHDQAMKNGEAAMIARAALGGSEGQ